MSAYKKAEIATRWSNFEDAFINDVIKKSKVYDSRWDTLEPDGITKGQHVINQQLDAKPIYHPNEDRGFIRRYYAPRYNEVTGRLDVLLDGEYTPITDYIQNSIRLALDKRGSKLKRYDLAELLESDFVPKYHPFREYFEGLPDVNGDNHISAFCDRVKIKDGNEPSDIVIDGQPLTNQQWFTLCMRRWLIATVAGAVNPDTVNHSVLILVGKQGRGKTTYTRLLLPKELFRYYYNGKINPENKDTEIYLSECLLIVWDEIGVSSRTGWDVIKETITKDKIRVRRPYARHSETLIRHASIIGSVNEHDLLNDPTGSRRFLIHEIDDAKDAIDYATPMLVDALWGQVYALYKQGEQYWFDGDFNDEISRVNQRFEKTSILEELLLEKFEPAGPETKEVLRRTATKILEELYKDKIPNGPEGSVVKLGKLLRKHGFTFVRNKTGTDYFVGYAAQKLVQTTRKALFGETG